VHVLRRVLGLALLGVLDRVVRDLQVLVGLLQEHRHLRRGRLARLVVRRRRDLQVEQGLHVVPASTVCTTAIRDVSHFATATNATSQKNATNVYVLWWGGCT
jgi:hypothetical protein